MSAVLSIKKAAVGLAALLLFASSPAASTPVAAPALSDNLGVFIRADDFSYARSEHMESTIKARREADWRLGKRSHAFVQACTDTACSNCRTVFNGDFSQNSDCLQAINTACMIISSLDNANVEYWNHPTCNGANTVWHGCGSTAFVSSPGTNSIGVHVGC